MRRLQNTDDGQIIIIRGFTLELLTPNFFTKRLLQTDFFSKRRFPTSEMRPIAYQVHVDLILLYKQIILHVDLASLQLQLNLHNIFE